MADAPEVTGTEDDPGAPPRHRVATAARAVGAGVAGAATDVAGAVRLLLRAADPVARTVLGGLGLLLVSALPLWIWLNIAIPIVDLTDVQSMTTGDVVQIVLLLALPSLAVLLAVALATFGAVTIVLDDVANGRRTRVLRSLGAGTRSMPRLFVALAPAVLAVAVLVVGAPEVVLLGILLVPITAIGRRLRPAGRWPTWRAVVTMIVPFGAAAAVAARWAVLPAAAVLERSGPRRSFARSGSITRPHVARVAVTLVLLVLAFAGVVLGVGMALHAAGASQLASDLVRVVIQGVGVLLAAALVVRLFVDGGGEALPVPDPAPPRVGIAAIVTFAVVAGLVPMLVGVAPAAAVVPGATLVVDDLGDDVDTDPGDGTCATTAGRCTLRAAVGEANAGTDHVIGFSMSGTITVSSELLLAAPMEIDGTGEAVVVSGGGATRVFAIRMEVPGGGYGAIRNLTVADGSDGSFGGSAISNDSASRGFVLDRVTVRDNEVTPGALFGGAVLNLSSLDIVNSTFSGNTSVTDGVDVANVFSGEMTVFNATFAGASGPSAISSTGSSLDITNSVVAGGAFACSGTITGSGNVTTDASPICPGGVATEAQLALQPLADNGGETPTMRLSPASVAVDAGDAAWCLPVDQRGSARPQGAACDAGAYEVDPATTTVLTVTPSPSSFGATVTLEATVSAASEPVTPSGSVQLRDGSSVLGTPTIGAGGTVSLAISSLAAGPHALTATFVPADGLAGSTSATVAHQVDPSTTSVTLESSGSPTVGGQSVTFTMQVSSPDSVATGSITLFDNGSTLAVRPLDGTGRATYSTTTLAGGHHELYAHYPGDAGHDEATSATIEHDVVTASTITLTPPAGPTRFGADAVFAVRVEPAPGGFAPTGGVSLHTGGAEIGVGTLDGDGEARVTVAGLAPGTHAVTAEYPGDPFNSASTSAPVDHVVTETPTTTGLVVTPAGTSVFGTTITLQATVDAPGSSVAPGGMVTFFDGTTPIGSAGVVGGVATLDIASLVPGAYELSAELIAATGFLASTSPDVAHTVVAAATSVTLSASAPSSVSGESVTLGATVTTGESPRTPTGTVTFRDGSTVIGVEPLGVGGVATLTTRAIAVGDRSLTAQYNGAVGFASTTSGPLAHAVTPASVAVTLIDVPDPSVYGGTVGISVRAAAVAPGSGTPTGSVVVREGTTVLATITLDGSGDGSASLTGLGVGAHSLVATYAGDGSFASGSATATHTVVGDTATVDLVSSRPSSTYLEPVTFTATVSGSGPATPTGSVTFRTGSGVIGTRSLDANGVARLTVADLPFGTFAVTADYRGDAGFGTASDTLVQGIAARSTGVTVTVDPERPTTDDVVTLTATVVGTGTTTEPTGSVVFADDGVVLATVPVTAGVATHGQTFGTGHHALTARFVGSPGWSDATSSAAALTVGRAPTTIVVTGAPDPVGVGGPVTWTATLAHPPTGPARTGSVRFWAGSAFLGAGAIDAGTATLTVPAPTVVGPWAVFATYDGDLSHEPGSSAEASVAVTAAATSTTAIIPVTAYASDGVTLAAQVTGPVTGAPIAGRVRFTSDSPGFTSLAPRVDSTGWASVLGAGFPSGRWTVTATFEPDAGTPFGSSIGSAPITVQRRSASVALQAPPTATIGQPVTATFSVADLTGTGPSPSGTVTVTAGNVTCTAPASAGRCPLVLASAGTFDLVATYSGDARYDGATSGTVVVRTAASTTNLTAWSPTTTWATGDPIAVVWRVTGPRVGEVVVTTPMGEACRSTVLDLGSCTVSFPFDVRGQTVPIVVSYAGSETWSSAAATVEQPVVGCYGLTFDVLPDGSGTIDPPAGNCNGGAGTLGGTAVGVVVEPVAPYVLDRWLEDGSTARARSFVVGEGSTSATALMRTECVRVSVTAVEQVDLGDLRSRGGTVDLPEPDCPNRSIERDPSTGTSTGWYRRGTSVTLTATPIRPATDELKGWYVDPVLDRSSAPYTFVATDDIEVEARFGVRCVSPTFASTGNGSVQRFTSPSCIGPDGAWAWQLGSRIGARVTSDPFYWIAGYGATVPTQTLDTPYFLYPGNTEVEQAQAFWVATADLSVEVSFETCRQLTLDPQGPGRIDPGTAPNCPSRPAGDGIWYRPTTTVDLDAVPDGPSTRRYSHESADGLVTEGFAEVVPTFRDWAGVDESGSEPAGPAGERHWATVDLRDDRTVTANFFDEGRCAPLVMRVVPAGIADLSVDLRDDDGSCPDGQYRQFDRYVGDLATFRATNIQTGKALEGWHVTTSGGANEVEHLVWNGTPDVPIEGATFATAYICRGIVPEVTLVAPDGSKQSGVTPPDASFVSADSDGDCPLWDNAYSIGSTVRIAALAPIDGYAFKGWEGDITGTDTAFELWFHPNGTFFRPVSVDDPEGSTAPWTLLPTVEDQLTVRAVYDVICAPLYITPPAPDSISVGPEGNCPGQDTEAPVTGATRYRFIAGTPVLLDAHHHEDHDQVAWSVRDATDPRRLLDRRNSVEALRAEGIDDLADVVEGLDHPAMITMDSVAVLDLPYREHSVAKQIGDDLAVGAKKLVGFMANFAVGAFETATGLVFGRLALLLVSTIATAIDANSPVGKYFRDAQEGLDVLEMGFICTKEWSQGGTRPPPPPNPLVADGTPTDEPPSSDQITIRRTIKTVSKAGKTAIDIALQRQLDRLGYKSTELVAKQTKYLTYTRYFNKGLGTAIGVGTSLYFTFVNGPGARYDDTAQEAWEQGGDVFMECLYRQIAEASDGHLPPLPES